jgi:hypothetical protein
MEQVMEHMLAETKTNQERTEAKREANNEMAEILRNKI